MCGASGGLGPAVLEALAAPGRLLVGVAAPTADEASLKRIRAEAHWERADLTDPKAVWDHPDLRAVINPARPVCVIMAAVLHFLDVGQARAVVSGYAERLVPGSVVAISVSHNDDQELHHHAHAAYTAGDLHHHSRAEIESFFGALELVPPGLALAQAWRGGMAEVAHEHHGSAYILAGVGAVRG